MVKLAVMARQAHMVKVAVMARQGPAGKLGVHRPFKLPAVRAASGAETSAAPGIILFPHAALFHGPAIGPVPAMNIEDIIGEMGEVVIRGKIINTDKREIRNEKTILFFDITGPVFSVSLWLAVCPIQPFHA